MGSAYRLAYRLERWLAAPAIAVLLAGCVYGTDPANSARTNGGVGADRPGSAAPVNGGARFSAAAAPLASKPPHRPHGAPADGSVAPPFPGGGGGPPRYETLR